MSSTGVSRIEGVDPFVAIKAPCKVATTANITLSGAQTVDGVSVTETTPKTRVLVKDQTDSSENAIYDVYDTAWKRSSDFNGARDVVDSTLVSVESGVLYGNTTWRVQAQNPISIGTTEIEFVLTNNLDVGVSIVSSFSALGSAPGSVGDIVSLRGHTTAGIGGGNFVAKSGSVTNDGGTQINSATAGVYWQRIYDNLTNTMFGALGDGSDDTAATQLALLALTSGKSLELIGNSILSASLVPTVDNTVIFGKGKLTAKAATNFEQMLIGTGRSKVRVIGLEFDCNKANRSSGQNVRFIGPGFSASNDCGFFDVTVRNARGYGGISAVGMFLSGNSNRCKADGCRFYDCGDAGFDSDGVFTKGNQNIISNCIAKDCTDVAFVLEDSNYGVISGCTSIDCAGGAAITNASGSDRRGNIINGLTVRNWSGASTGGIQIGNPAAAAGDLLDTVVNGIVMSADTAVAGAGAAINIRAVGTGRVKGLTIAGSRFNGSVNQLILVNGDDVHISGCDLKGSTDSAIQFQDGTTGGFVSGTKITGGSYGVSTAGTAEASVQGIICDGQTSSALYAFDTSTLTIMDKCIYKNQTGTTTAKDSGATFGQKNIVLAYSATIATNASNGETFVITATNNTAFTISNPTKPTHGQIITYRIKNTSGGALGAITWGTGFYMSAWTSPATGYSRSISFLYDGTSWIQQYVGVDVPN